MNRNLTTTAVTLGAPVGLVAGALTAVPGVGVGGAYVFALIGLFAVCIFLVWSDIRTRFSVGRSTGHRRTKSGQAGVG